MVNSNPVEKSNWLQSAFLVVLGVLLLGLLVILGALISLLTGLPLPTLLARFLDWLFALSSVQAMWYITRAAGLVAYLLLWLSTAWGLVVATKILDPLVHRALNFDLHEYLSLLAIAFAALHIVVLLWDHYLPFSPGELLVPFVASYRPLWTGIGIIGLYLTVLVSVTFYLRRQIGIRAFRVIHWLSFIAYALVTLHGLNAGTDSPLWSVKLMYAGTALVTVFLTAYWLALRVASPRRSPQMETTL